jgi:hypothetical protein|tara:strand:+ start:73711 stop:73854 length:144 start_codon:yes stop_codon:yes gene_type:complete
MANVSQRLKTGGSSAIVVLVMISAFVGMDTPRPYVMQRNMAVIGIGE